MQLHLSGLTTKAGRAVRAVFQSNRRPPRRMTGAEGSASGGSDEGWDSTNPGPAEGSRRGHFGAGRGRSAHKNRKKSRKIETNFEAFSLILKIVRVKNRISECMKSLLRLFLISSEPLREGDWAKVAKSLTQMKHESSFAERANRICIDLKLMV